MPTVLHSNFERHFYHGDIPEIIRRENPMVLATTKSALSSKTVWGSLLGIAGTILQVLQTSGSIPSTGSAPIIMTGAGALIAFLGRLVAKKKISGIV